MYHCKLAVVRALYTQCICSMMHTPTTKFTQSFKALSLYKSMGYVVYTIPYKVLVDSGSRCPFVPAHTHTYFERHQICTTIHVYCITTTTVHTTHITIIINSVTGYIYKYVYIYRNNNLAQSLQGYIYTYM